MDSGAKFGDGGGHSNSDSVDGSFCCWLNNPSSVDPQDIARLLDCPTSIACCLWLNVSAFEVCEQSNAAVVAAVCPPMVVIPVSLGGWR